jgi:hypothetical protein
MSPTQSAAAAAGALTLAVALAGPARAQGADVILGELGGLRQYAASQGIVALTVGTTSCNAGDQVLEWRALPNNRHPVITMNLYRLLNGRLTQIGQSWVKHGFVALQEDVCQFGCAENPSGAGLGVGCSDPYGPSTNQGPRLGSRRLINATTGAYDGPQAQAELNAFRPATPIDHGLQVRESDLAMPGARYFVEGQYIAPDDSIAGNGHNNVSHMEVSVTRNAQGAFVFTPTVPGPSPTVREMPAIRAWPYADFAVLDSGLEDGRMIVASRATRISRTSFRYEYAVYNQTSERGVRSFTVPLGTASITNVGSSAPFSHGEPFTNDAWEAIVDSDRITWSTRAFADDPNANAIRWGTTYNFWFEAATPPAEIEAVVARFKPGVGPPNASAKVQGPRRTGAVPAAASAKR